MPFLSINPSKGELLQPHSSANHISNELGIYISSIFISVVVYIGIRVYISIKKEK